MDKTGPQSVWLAAPIPRQDANGVLPGLFFPDPSFGAIPLQS